MASTHQNTDYQFNSIQELEEYVDKDIFSFQYRENFKAIFDILSNEFNKFNSRLTQINTILNPSPITHNFIEKKTNILNKKELFNNYVNVNAKIIEENINFYKKDIFNNYLKLTYSDYIVISDLMNKLINIYVNIIMKFNDYHYYINSS